MAEESSGCKGILGQAIWLLSGRSGGSSYTPERVDQERNGKTVQEKILIKWAKALNISSKKSLFFLTRFKLICQYLDDLFSIVFGDADFWVDLDEVRLLLG